MIAEIILFHLGVLVGCAVAIHARLDYITLTGIVLESAVVVALIFRLTGRR